MDNILTNASPRFTLVDESISNLKAKKSAPRSSLERLIYNSEHLADVLHSNKKLKSIRFDELELLRDIRELVETNSIKFDKLKKPEEFRREIRATILPRYITGDLIKNIEEKLLAELFASRLGKDQDALITALVFLQSHTDLNLPVEDNPLWETIFNISLKDGLQFVDTLTVLLEGMDSLKVKDPDLLNRDPLILQKTKQICQWHVFWRRLIEHKEIKPFEGLISSILRGEIMIELYFDELVHLPYYLYQLFKDKMNQTGFLSEVIPDGDQEKLSEDLKNAILKSVEKDLPFILPTLIKRVDKLIKKVKKFELRDQLQQAVDILKLEDNLANNIFLLILIAAKISMKKYWENRRDRFFFFTILKNPLDAKNYFDYGNILMRLKKSKTAEQLFRCALEIDNDAFWGCWGLGQFYLKKNQIDKAELNLTQALAKAQKAALQQTRRFHRELFLIKEDVKKLNRKKIRNQAKLQPQIELF
ncbi:hypothetical protein B6I21_07890 [candidate division KSB1 bacterium 4572_119]|nr:MAG: hypothetical protein B6I21_07890 [candidate division KSB1 bacterium 4572_119]